MRPAWTDKVEEVLAAAPDKRAAAERLGVHPASVRSFADARPDMLAVWRALPAGNAWSGRGRGVPAPHLDQAAADALVAEAAMTAPPRPSNTQRRNLVRLLLAMRSIHGSMAFPLGWVRSVLLALEAASCPRPTPASVRWYKCRLQSGPAAFEAHAAGFEAEMAALADRAYG